MPTLSPGIQPEALELSVKYRAIVRFIPDPPLIVRIQYELSYERSNKRLSLRTTHKARHFGANLKIARANARRTRAFRCSCCRSIAGSARKPRPPAQGRSRP